MEVAIHELSYAQPSLIINNIVIKISNIIFSKCATFQISLFPEGSEYIDRPLVKYITIEGQEYYNWGGGINGDDYIINLICQKLGVQRK